MCRLSLSCLRNTLDDVRLSRREQISCPRARHRASPLLQGACDGRADQRCLGEKGLHRSKVRWNGRTPFQAGGGRHLASVSSLVTKVYLSFLHLGNNFSLTFLSKRSCDTLVARVLNRIPCEEDIRDLSSTLVDSLLLARSVRELCVRHRSELRVPLGKGAEAHGGIRAGAEDGVVRLSTRDTQLWVNDQISDVRIGVLHAFVASSRVIGRGSPG